MRTVFGIKYVNLRFQLHNQCIYMVFSCMHTVRKGTWSLKRKASEMLTSQVAITMFLGQNIYDRIMAVPATWMNWNWRRFVDDNDIFVIFNNFKWIIGYWQLMTAILNFPALSSEVNFQHEVKIPRHRGKNNTSKAGEYIMNFNRWVNGGQQANEDCAKWRTIPNQNVPAQNKWRDTVMKLMLKYSWSMQFSWYLHIQKKFFTSQILYWSMTTFTKCWRRYIK